MRDKYRQNVTRHKGWAQRVMVIAAKSGFIRPRDLTAKGIPLVYLSRMVHQGLLEKLGRGLYRLPAAEISENHTFAELAKRAPRAIICLLSALRFHGLTTQAPHEVWLAIGGKQRQPRITDRKLRIVRFSGAAMQHGIQEHVIEGVKVKVYSPAKTVADCFKCRVKVGQEVAIEALRDCLQARKATPAELWEAAKVCRVAGIMRPYLEALL